jgi:pimeloyl-ACP methyl ester carboxylesterase
MTEAARHFQRWLRWFIPGGWYPSLARMPRVTCPVLSLHGTADEVVPEEMGQRLFAAAPARSGNGIAKAWVAFPQAGHNGLAVSHAPLLKEAVARFLGEVVSAAEQRTEV